LVSTGRGSEPAGFMDASPSGSDVFFATRQRLLPGDTDNLVDVYDARVGGGFAGPVATPAPCSGDTCQGAAAAAPPPSAPPSTAFLGSGNLHPPAPPTTKPLTARQKLAKALRACRKRPRHQRRRCESQARKLYATHASTTTRRSK
jgi:hypothetical protein